MRVVIGAAVAAVYVGLLAALWWGSRK